MNIIKCLKNIKKAIFLFVLFNNNSFALSQNTCDDFYSMSSICISGSNKTDDCNKLRVFAKKYEIKQLDELANLRENKILDKGDKVIIEITKAVLENAEMSYGENSVEAMCARRAVIDASSSINGDMARNMANKNAEIAKQLLTKSPKDKFLCRMKILTTLENIILQLQHDKDNPYAWKELIQTEKEAESILTDKQINEDIIYICQDFAIAKSYESTYLEYLNFISGKVFPHGVYMNSDEYDADVFNNDLIFISKAYDMAKTLWGEDDIRTQKINYLMLSIQLKYRILDYNSIYPLINAMENKLKSLLPEDDILILQTEMLKWDCKTSFGKQVDTNIAELTLRKIENHYGKNTDEYLDWLDGMMFRMSNVSMELTKKYAEELKSLTEQLSGTSSGEFINNYCDYLTCLILMQDEQTIKYITHNAITYYEVYHKPTWLSIYAGRQLANILAIHIGLPESSIKIMNIVIEDTEKLDGKESDLLPFCLVDLVACESLSDDDEIVKRSVIHLETAIEGFKKIGHSNLQLYLDLNNAYSSINKDNEAQNVLRKGIKIASDQNDILWKAYLQLQLAEQLMLTYRDTAEIQKLYDEALPVFMPVINELPLEFINIYGLIADYYMFKTDYKQAEIYYKKGIERHEQISGEYTKDYVSLIKSLYGLYANELNDWDKAEKLMTKHVKNIKQNPSIALHKLAFDLLMQRYLFQTHRNNDILTRMMAMYDVYDEVKIIIDLAGENHQQLIPLIKPFAIELVYLMVELKVYIIQSEHDLPLFTDNKMKQDAERMLKNMKDNLNENMAFFKSLCEEMEENSNINNDSFRDTATLFDLTTYNAIVSYNINLNNDTAKAERQLINMSQAKDLGVRCNGTKTYADLLYGKQQYQKAADSYADVLELKKQLPLYMAAPSEMADFYKAYFWALYNSNNFEQALNAARELHKYKKKVIVDNFDLITEEEREAVLLNGGAGGYELQVILNKMPDNQQLCGEVYNSLLEEKGILLRASDRIKRKIVESDDQELKEMYNKLVKLKTKYSSINLETMYMGGRIDSQWKALKEEIDQLEREINRKVNVEDYDKNLEWRIVQSRLDYNQAAVEFFTTNEFLNAMILNNNNIQYIQLCRINDILPTLESIMKKPLKQRIEELYQNDVCKLYENIWQPMDKLLQDAETVFVSPDAFLNFISFNAIKIDEHNRLMDKYKIRQVLSTANIPDRQSKVDNSIRNALLLGGVYYSPEQKDLANKIDNNPQFFDEYNRKAVNNNDFNYLPFTKYEVKQVADLLKKNKIDYNLLSEDKATEKAFRAIDKNSPDFILLSTHGYYLDNDIDVYNSPFMQKYSTMKYSSMLRSGLALYNANDAWNGMNNAEDNEDGILTASEVAKLDLTKTKVVVLSACQTAVGSASREGVFGMNRGFKQAGVNSIIATLWNVNDKTTAQMMETFFKLWLKGNNMQDAFDEALKETRKKHPNPMYWAPFVLVDAMN